MVDWYALDYSMAPQGYRELRTDHVWVELCGMRYFLLTGRDHRDWLQGQATNDVRLLESEPWLDFCLTKPTGQILALCRAWDRRGETVIATQQDEALKDRVEQSVILEQVALTPLPGEMVCVQGVETKRIEGSLFSDRTGSGGVERPIHDLPTPKPLSEEGFQLATLEAGIPLEGADYTDKTLPPELGPNFVSQHVSYEKGCYVGQEVLVRIKSRGHTNKTWVGLRAQTAIAPGATVQWQGKDVGTVHRAAHSPAFGHIASATLRNEAAQEHDEVQVGGAAATVVQMPFLRP